LIKKNKIKEAIMAKIVVNGVEIEIPDVAVEEVDTETEGTEEVEFEESSRESYNKAGKSGSL
jgi:hypothetical protein